LLAAPQVAFSNKLRAKQKKTMDVKNHSLSSNEEGEGRKIRTQATSIVSEQRKIQMLIAELT
jgi:hypothetical protein